MILLNLVACDKNEKEVVDVSKIDVNVDVRRFEQRFYTAGPENLSTLKSDFPFLFPEPNPDSVWTAKMKDEDELFLYKASQEVFGDFSKEKIGLAELFKHVKYYFPKFEAPRVITILSNVDYDNRIIYADSLMFVSLDVYLGREHEVYEDYPNYIKQNFTPDHLMVDAARELANPVVKPNPLKSYISKIIQEGKKMYTIAAFLPAESEQEIMGYSPEQYEWAVQSESNIWKYFIQKEMLYSNDPTLTERFISDAPFSKFYLEVDKDSPGRIGVWFGWQIVNSFMEHNDLSLQEMLAIDNEELFTKSKYKPKKK
ncbi:gliding motility lipoprotein GldB [Lutimonas halocynthiae]|uniref:gliding motility lipoprotein GldB n=1 Tax=Lutimonas halocynthiae TaxID=1446477 RepID=UPI0025B517EE|nr:gliding motility lipoprotein GldB [Lutimonas halocynthiae]MDN3642605.1 gliding motility lipoprotein GldB [Lutimonas halocynthiae]